MTDDIKALVKRLPKTWPLALLDECLSDGSRVRIEANKLLRQALEDQIVEIERWERGNEHLKQRVAELEAGETALREAREALGIALDQWRMYAEMEEGRDLDNQQDVEACLYRVQKRAIPPRVKRSPRHD